MNSDPDAGKHDPEPNPEEAWDEPHIDAEAYFTEIIEELEIQLLGEPNPATLMADDDYLRNLQGGIPSVTRASLERDLETDREFELPQNPNDTRSYVTDALHLAELALANRDVDTVLEQINALVDLTPADRRHDPLDTSYVEEWAGLLDLDAEQGAPESDEADLEQAVAIAVQDLSRRLCELIAADPTTLQHVEWRHLEHVVATALAGIGFEVEVTPPAKDGGKDVVAMCFFRGHRRTYFVEIKHWRSGKRVNSQHVFDFVEVNLTSSTAGGLYLSSSGYTRAVSSFLTELYRYQVHLAGKQKIVSLCQRFARKRAGLWYPVDNLPSILFEGTL
ncbi:restriction endonuclease [Candidatus Eisenbacteria bacterium]|uniref:Restriction endonuclease n=1 Tax=Eiseniibacteriota bacterium TaxID=2212470 RepID=A0ABV6YKH3_UNCEI